MLESEVDQLRHRGTGKVQGTEIFGQGGVQVSPVTQGVAQIDASRGLGARIHGFAHRVLEQSDGFLQLAEGHEADPEAASRNLVRRTLQLLPQTLHRHTQRRLVGRNHPQAIIEPDQLVHGTSMIDLDG